MRDFVKIVHTFFVAFGFLCLESQNTLAIKGLAVGAGEIGTFLEVEKLVKSDEIIEVINAANEEHKNITFDEIKKLDKEWKDGTLCSSKALIEQIKTSKISKILKEFKNQKDGLITEIFITDFKGLNVGMSDTTSDYYQGDEKKFQNTFEKGPEAVYLSDVEFDESSQTFQVQLSQTISQETAAGVTPIGTITFGIDAEKLENILDKKTKRH